MNFIDDLWRDLDRRTRMGAGLVDIALDPGAWVVATYRVGRAIRALPRPLRAPLFALQKPIEWALRTTTGVKLPVEAEIGGGLYLAHTGSITVSKDARIGRDCNLSHGAYIGGRGADAPYVGDRVYIGPGARIFGPVRVGNDAAVGSNAVVNMDVPDGGAVGGARGRSMTVQGRKRPPLADSMRHVLRGMLPKPTQLLVRAG